MGVSSEDCGSGTPSGGFSFPKNLSVWWNEETEYVLQRIERWAACARGYNRLRSVRLSPGRMTMQEEPDSRWNLNRGRNRLADENNGFHRRTRPAPEETRLSCCALSNFNYKSNANLDSNCLEAYSMDHSIYFKTVGEIRNELGPKTLEGNNNAKGREIQPRTLPLDCGDFLSSDFDEDDDEDDDEELAAELDNVDFELCQQLNQLELGSSCNVYTSSIDELRDDETRSATAVIRLCPSSQFDEDEMNNNGISSEVGFKRQLAMTAAQ